MRGKWKEGEEGWLSLLVPPVRLYWPSQGRQRGRTRPRGAPERRFGKLYCAPQSLLRAPQLLWRAQQRLWWAQQRLLRAQQALWCPPQRQKRPPQLLFPAPQPLWCPIPPLMRPLHTLVRGHRLRARTNTPARGAPLNLRRAVPASTPPWGALSSVLLIHTRRADGFTAPS